ncbi:hypothetical protein [Limnohabitans sp. Rim11]|uniref:hypothetical protein n=1 Tax=Limnohabitans sp. Rim11 TaxID=1100719 RepID=UPI000A7B7272|nr:hypothetical protein [Limnohabitans sp. Rim11]
MSAHAMELVLYDLGVKREARTAFGEDAAAFLKRYGVDASESEMIRSFNMAGLLKAGVSPLLTYGFWMMNAPVKTRVAYLERSRETA